jgi:hypothetical protein
MVKLAVAGDEKAVVRDELATGTENDTVSPGLADAGVAETPVTLRFWA